MSDCLINMRIEDHVTTSIKVNTIAIVPKITNSSLGLYLIAIVPSFSREFIPEKLLINSRSLIV